MSSLIDRLWTNETHRNEIVSHPHDTLADIIILTEWRGGYGSLLSIIQLIVAVFRIWWSTKPLIGARTTAPSQNRHDSASWKYMYSRFFYDQRCALKLVQHWCPLDGPTPCQLKIDFIYLFARVNRILRYVCDRLLALHQLVRKSYSHHFDLHQVQRRQVSAKDDNRVNQRFPIFSTRRPLIQLDTNFRPTPPFFSDSKKRIYKREICYTDNSDSWWIGLK